MSARGSGIRRRGLDRQIGTVAVGIAGGDPQGGGILPTQIRDMTQPTAGQVTFPKATTGDGLFVMDELYGSGSITAEQATFPLTISERFPSATADFHGHLEVDIQLAGTVSACRVELIVSGITNGSIGSWVVPIWPGDAGGELNVPIAEGNPLGTGNTLTVIVNAPGASGGTVFASLFYPGPAST
jgi:hypothetical protein